MTMYYFTSDFTRGASAKDYMQEFIQKREDDKQEKVFFVKIRERENLKGE